MKKDIIMFGMMSYDDFAKGIDNTNAHILRWLQHQTTIEKILFIDFNQFDLISKLKYCLKNKFFIRNHLTQKNGFGWRLDKISDKVYRFSGSYSTVPKAMAELNITIAEIWSFNPFDVTFLQYPSIKKIFYAIDDWRKNSLFLAKVSHLEYNYKIIGEQADVIFSPSKNALSTIWPNNKKCNFITNGVDLDFFSNPTLISEQLKKRLDQKLNNITNPIVGYLGVITPDRLDFELIEYVIASNPDKSFVFAGPVWGRFDSNSLLTKYSNVFFLGMVFYAEMPYLLSKFDICLIPHLINDFIQSMNPKKLYEYLAAGKPVVATPVSGTENFKEIIYLSKSKENFNLMLNKAIKENSPALIEARQKSVQPFSWNLRFSQMQSLLSK